MTKRELAILIKETEAKHQKAKNKRNLIIIFSFSIAYFYLLTCAREPARFPDYAVLYIVSVIIATISHFVNAVIYDWLVRKGMSEAAQMEYLNKQWREMQ